MAKHSHDTTFDLFPLNKADGRLITEVHDADDHFRLYKVKVRVPGPSKLMTFDLKFGTRHLLCLDPYGKDTLSDNQWIERRLVGPDLVKHGWLLAVDLNSGELFVVSIQRNRKRVFAAVLHRFMNDRMERPDMLHRVPKRYLKPENIESLRSAKRPWDISFTAEALTAFHSRHYNWTELLQHSVVQLDLFKRGRKHTRKYLELWFSSNRIVEEWRD